MDFQGLLNQVLGGQTNQSNTTGTTSQNTNTGGSGINPALTGLASGAIGGTVMGLLMGSKKGRKMGKGVAKVGGAAALGALALKAYQSWQQNSTTQSAQPTSSAPSQAAQPVQTAAPQAQIPAQIPEVNEVHSKQILKAMIGAAKADGHVDEQERQRIQQAVTQSGASATVSQFVDMELSKPLDPADVAAGADSPEFAAELYLVSVLMVDDQNFMEKSYLQELARQLNIAPELAQQLEQQALSAG